MRTALTHLRDWSCLAAAFATILYLTLVPHRPPVPNRDLGTVLSATLEHEQAVAVPSTAGLREAVR
jgi:hypothetical protein